jgi:hypothetical protein
MAKNRFRRWLKVFVALALAMVGLSYGLSRVMASDRVHGYLTPRFEQAFGRKVEVSYYDIRWLPTPGIVAHQVTIGEDPRFGEEYFLRAQSVVASPRWRSLLAGKLELGTLELSQPSLNLVRNADGRWNVENWLPTPQQIAPAKPGEVRPGRESARLTRIEIDGGRINFSRGIDRRPFALVDVAGSIEQQSPGRWQISLEARPIRATVQLQSTGLLRVTGNISGTTARLQPAMLSLTWSNASLADALRLTTGYDHGVRGNFDIELTARILKAPEGSAPVPARWEFSLGAHAAGLHRWDMASRDDNPQMSVRAAGAWQLGSARFDLTKLLVEGPNSNISGAGVVDWSRGIVPDIRVWSSGVSFVDVVAWYRAFQSGVADGITANGSVDGFASLHGWPLRPEWGSVDSDGLSLQLPNKLLLQMRTPHISAEKFAIQSNHPYLVFSENESTGAPPHLLVDPYAVPDSASVNIGAEPIRIPVRLNSTSQWKYSLGIFGEFAHSELLLSAARALGRPLNNNWDAEGVLTGNVKWEWKSGERFPKPSGKFTLRDFALRLAFMNQPIQIENEEVEIKGSERRVDISSATAFGAKWRGTILRHETRAPDGKPNGVGGWEFDLTADHLESAELDRWLRLPAQSAQVSANAPMLTLRAQGKLNVDTFSLPGLELQKASALVALDGRRISFSHIDAKASGGSVAGELVANLDADPSYQLHVIAARLDASTLVAKSASLAGQLAGQVSGEGEFSMHGVGRETLLSSLEGSGNFSTTRATVRGLDLGAATSGVVTEPSTTGQFSLISGRFSVAESIIRFEKINLIDAKESYEGKGTIRFTLGILFQLRPVARRAGQKRTVEGPADRMIRVTGLLEAPRVSPEPVPRAASLTTPQPATPVTRH